MVGSPALLIDDAVEYQTLGAKILRGEGFEVFVADDAESGVVLAREHGHVVDVHIANLRRKLGLGSDAEGWIRTVRGVGYRFEPSGS